jgi:hypothetical protein
LPTSIPAATADLTVFTVSPADVNAALAATVLSSAGSMSKTTPEVVSVIRLDKD